MLVAAALFPGAALAAAKDEPSVVVAVVPSAATPAELGQIPGMALGLLGAGIGPVPASQTYLDASQGNRVNPSLYGSPLPPLGPRRAGGRLAVPRPAWARVRARADSAPADIVPGLLGSALERAGVASRATPDAGTAAVIGVNEGGRVRIAGAKCDEVAVDRAIGGKRRLRSKACPGLTVVRASIAGVRSLAAHVRATDLLIALSSSPPAPNHELPVGIAGAGFSGELTSESTHTGGLVLDTDLAPTILRRLGVVVPSAMAGEAITASGSADPAALADLDARLSAVPARRGHTVGLVLIAWLGAALLGAPAGRRGLRVAFPLLACTVFYLPALLLVTAALEPGATAETLIVALGGPALAVSSVLAAGPWGGLAIASAVSVGGHAIDVVAGSTLTSASLIGPDPAGGTRLYGIGNELEAIAATALPIGVGAALTAWRPRAGRRAAAAAFAIAALLAIAAFAPGRFGADVGAAVDLSLGAVAAAVICLGTGRGRAVAVAIAVPVCAVAALAIVDLASGGGAHLTRSVLRAGGLGDLGQLAERRLRLSADNFASYRTSAAFWIAVALIVAGIVARDRIAGFFAGRRYAGAGFVGAVAGAAAAVLVNDSGGLMLMICVLPLMLTACVAWATQSPRAAR
jgi:hypothetical protein